MTIHVRAENNNKKEKTNLVYQVDTACSVTVKSRKWKKKKHLTL